MSKTKTKSIIGITILTVILTSILSFAAPTIFTDIEGHWGKPYIEGIYSRKITAGYPDATFKPQGNITKLESVVMIAKLMGYSDSEEGYYINQYKKKLEENNIPEWGQGPTAYALFNDILLMEDLSTLVSSTSTTYAKRHEIAVYIGRVLEYGAGEEIGKIYVIPYKDEISIPNQAKKYIDLLLNKDILDKTSNDGKFLPNDPITRAEIAKLVSLSAEILDQAAENPDNNPPDDKPMNPPTEVEREIIDGYIDNIIISNKNIISIKDGSKVESYNIGADVYITLDGKSVDLDDLEKGQSVTAIVEDDLLVNIKATSNKLEMEGYFYGYLSGQNPEVFIKDSRDKVHSFEITTNTKIYLMDKPIYIEDLKLGDAVTIRYMDDQVIEIEADPKEKEYKGLVKAKSASRDENTLEVLLDDETREIFTITSKATLRRDRKYVYFEDIKVGDEVEIIKEYDTIVSVKAFSVRRTVEGYIRSINIGKETEITVENYDGDTEVFTLTPDSVIRLEEKRVGIYDLRPNYEVELEIENNEVSWVDAYRKIQGNTYNGKVTYMDSRREILEIEVGAREKREIHTDDDTMYIDEYGETIGFRDINYGDEVVIIAEDKGYYSIATRVLIMIRR